MILKGAMLKSIIKGLYVIKSNPEVINVKYLNQFENFKEFRKRKNKQLVTKSDEDNQENDSLSPEEMVEKSIDLISADLAEELLEKILRNSPVFFENLVLDLLDKMGYGQGKVTRRSGDGGIDGFIIQDALGIEKIYFQVKRFTNTIKISVSMVRDFVGSLDLKGVFITSIDFPSNTENVLSGTHKSIVLINQKKLLNLMMKYNVGVSIEKIYEIKKK